MSFRFVYKLGICKTITILAGKRQGIVGFQSASLWELLQIVEFRGDNSLRFTLLFYRWYIKKGFSICQSTAGWSLNEN